MLSVDTNSLRHLPRRSSKNCDVQFANSDRFKKNSGRPIHIRLLLPDRHACYEIVAVATTSSDENDSYRERREANTNNFFP